MNPGGITEEVGSTTRSFIDAMKDQPFMLVCGLINFVMLGLLFYIAHSVAGQRAREIGLIYDNQKSIQDLIVKACINPLSSQGMRLQSDESQPVDIDKLVVPLRKPDEPK